MGVILAALALAAVLPLWWRVLIPVESSSQVAPLAVPAMPTIRTGFAPPNGGRRIRSLSVHPSGDDWLFVECSGPGGERCDVMRYQRSSGKLFRYGLPEGYLYTHAHYSPHGHYVVMSRRPVYGDSEADARRSVDDSQIALMRSDGSAFDILLLARGIKLSPFMSQDETRIAFWRSGRLLPPGRRLRLLDFDVWEFDRRSAAERPFGGTFAFVAGGQAQYLSDDEILFHSFGPGDFLSTYMNRYQGSQIYRMRRGVQEVPTPEVFPGIRNARIASMDDAGNQYLWGQTPESGLAVIRVSAQGARVGWQQALSFHPRELVCDPHGGYVVALHSDQPFDPADRLAGISLLNIATGTWSPIPLPAWEDAEIMPVTVRDHPTHGLEP
ncbi:Uncharacterised protein [Achromobacter sp. 2789STDY5608615]|uniref:hypothetical protein n=1 Tax=Achromobacter sp. 2789STDY5608615 TaxID=1806492 RepID=UPI0006C72CBB|nr:hypothetical protein [Achromobacter sp. 2789STDY5608615]CUJ95777.1 Uncharacterised protein [Achromobacter sp. 2789STDY5608615]